VIPLHEELKFVGDYLDIEKMRLGDRLKIDWHVSPETRSMLVPQMILQPLVENAIRHGIASSRENGWVELSTRSTGGALSIKVRNSVGGKRSDGTGVGLLNVKSRLQHLYSGEADLRFAIAEDRTATAELTLPALDSQLQHQQTDEETDKVDSDNAARKTLCVSSSSTTSP
jgi:two-component system sensor histidine kinase AlgZ